MLLMHGAETSGTGDLGGDGAGTGSVRSGMWRGQELYSDGTITWL